MRIAVLFLAAALWPSSSLAMNWEGHDDDWFLDSPYVRALEDAIPQARPAPARDCPVSEAQAKANPYEQIPLPRHRCPPPGKVKKR